MVEVVVRFRGVDCIDVPGDMDDNELIALAIEDLVRRTDNDVRRFLLDNTEMWVETVSEV